MNYTFLQIPDRVHMATQTINMFGVLKSYTVIRSGKLTQNNFVRVLSLLKELRGEKLCNLPVGNLIPFSRATLQILLNKTQFKISDKIKIREFLW